MFEFPIPSVAIGGGFGSVARYIIAREMGRLMGTSLPYGTLFVNIVGSLALGWMATYFMSRPEINNTIKLGLTVGFLGAFTTFSTFSLESIELFLEGSPWKAIINISANLIICLGMCYLGMRIAQPN